MLPTLADVGAAAFNVDEDFNRFDGFDFIFGKGSGTLLKITNTHPKTFHLRILYTNKTAMEINSAGGATTLAIVEVPGMPPPGMPPSCGPSIACSSAAVRRAVRGSGL